jgi:hypothetical protein
VRACLDKLTLVKNDDAIGVLDGREPVAMMIEVRPATSLRSRA